MKQRIEWFGNAGHFCCGQWCRFHLTTLVNGLWLVSTVGEYVHPRHSGGNEQTEALWISKNYPGEDIGLNRKYETMVFRAGTRCDSKQCGCRMPRIDGSELDSNGYNNAGAAKDGHMEMISKWSKKKAGAN